MKRALKNSKHLEPALLIEFLDNETSKHEVELVSSHLASCAACRERQAALAHVSSEIDSFFAALPVPSDFSTRKNLEDAMRRTAVVGVRRISSDSSKVMRRFGWGMGIAAAIAIALVWVPAPDRITTHQAARVTHNQVAAIDVNGESFVALPYSNPDLPLNAPRIVEMQVPVSSLIAAGILFEPTGALLTNGSSDRMVPANVLLGIDGQPLGVHVLDAEAERDF